MTQAHIALTVVTPDQVAECWEGVDDPLYQALWDLVPLYDKIDRENCGPADVIGLNSVASFWDRLSDDNRAELNRLAQREEETWNG